MGQRNNPTSLRTQYNGLWKTEVQTPNLTLITQLWGEFLKTFALKTESTIICNNIKYATNEIYIYCVVYFPRKILKRKKFWFKPRYKKKRKPENVEIIRYNFIKISKKQKNLKKIYFVPQKKNSKKTFIFQNLQLLKLVAEFEKSIENVSLKKIRFFVKTANSYKSGGEADKLKKKYEKSFFFKKQKNLIQTIQAALVTSRFNSATTLCSHISKSLPQQKRHSAYLHGIKAVLVRLNNEKKLFSGLHILVWGKLRRGKGSRAKKFDCKIGSVPFNSIQSSIDYSVSHSRSSRGVFGVKIFLTYE